MEKQTEDPLVFTVLNEIGIIDQLASTQLERALPDGLKISHFVVLNHFARLGGEENPAQLARAFQVTKGAITNTLQRLEARGLVTIRPDPRDGRGKLVGITDAGLEIRRRAIQAVAPAIADMVAHLPRQDFADALPFLQRLRAYLDEARN